MAKSKLRPFCAAIRLLLVLLLIALASVGTIHSRQQAATAGSSEINLTVDPAHSSVHWTVDTTLHTVHGTFTLTSGALHWNPQNGAAGGEILVSAKSGQSGNSSRDAKMHKEILETPKYPDLVFRPTLLEGHLAASGPSDARLHGTLSLHGADHDLVVPVHAVITGNHWKGTSTFEVPYISWGIKDPSNFLLKVKPVVNVDLDLAGEVKTSD